MNGEVMSYDLSKPMNWSQFRAMPADIQKEYMQKLTDDIGASRKDVADMFGITAQNLSDYLLGNHKGVYFFRGKKTNQEAFMKWCCGDVEKKDEVVEVVEEVATNTDEKEVEKATSFIEVGELEFYGTAKEVFDKMIMFLDGNEKYRIRIGFKKEVA